jgi:hypothetical protein
MNGAPTKVLHMLSILALMLFAVVTPSYAAHYVIDNPAAAQTDPCDGHGPDLAAVDAGKAGDQSPTKEKVCCAAHCASHNHVSLRTDAIVSIDWIKSPALKPGDFAFGIGLALDTPKRPPRA